MRFARFRARFARAFRAFNTELCSQCGVTTAGEVVYTVQGLLVHEQCFRCADCARVLSLQTFLWAGNYLYCRTHYHARFARKCAICEELALDAMLWLNGRFYHANCLECARCHRSIWPGHYLDRSGGYIGKRDTGEGKQGDDEEGPGIGTCGKRAGRWDTRKEAGLGTRGKRGVGRRNMRKEGPDSPCRPGTRQHAVPRLSLMAHTCTPT